MSQGLTIKGKTPTGQNIEVQVDSAGVVQVNNVGSTSSGNTTDPYGLNDKGSDVTYQYYGYENPAGAWYIRRVNPTTGNVTYAAGASNYAAAWAAKAGASYATFGATF